MGRMHRRVSRGLIALLVVVVAIGGVFYFHNTNKSVAREARPAAGDTGSARNTDPAVSAPDAANPAAVTSAPRAEHVTVTPSTLPSGIASSAIALGRAPDLLPTPGSRVTDSTATPTTAPSTTQPSVASSATPPQSPAAMLAAGMTRKAAGELLAARRLLNDALRSGQLSGNDARSAKSVLAELNAAIVFSPRKFADDEYGGTYTVKSGELMKKIADSHEITWELICRINGISDPRRLRAGQTIKVINGPFYAVVNKHDYTMDLYLGGLPGEKSAMYVMSFPVGLGADNSTPTGTWQVEPHKKIKNPVYYSPRGEGVIDADDPKNPLGERWIGLVGIDGSAVGKESYGIHGTIEPDTIGKMASMGCIRLKNEDVERVFEMLVEGKSTVAVIE